jgi:formamidopyrimidine-DNA glycosylase
MPELPEVEAAARLARAIAEGRVITNARVLHASLRRRLPDEAAAALSGDAVEAVERRGKHQLLRLSSGRTLHVHFRMTGDWVARLVGAGGLVAEGSPPGDSLPRHARFVLDFDGGAQLILDDPRALSAVALLPVGTDPLPALGPDATDAPFNADWLARALSKRRIPIKVALLDQRVVAGVGNIYASEALWYARVDPRRSAATLSRGRVARVVAGVRRALAKALRHPERYYGGAAVTALRFNVYDREGKTCRRCGRKIRRIVQTGRSTYFCGRCQR